MAATAPAQARDRHHGGGAAAAGFAAGAIVGAAAASSYNNGYYYGGDYAYEPGFTYYSGPAYYDYTYVGPRYRSPYANNQGPGCIQSPASINYSSCN